MEQELTPPPGMRFFFQSLLEAARALNFNAPGNWLSKLWFITLSVSILISLLMGCSASRWSPTDPRLETADPADAEVIERWEITVAAEVNP